MSKVIADTLQGRAAGNEAPNFPKGATVTGVLTATSADFSGTVSVGGTITYEDVTQVDSVGIVTAGLGVRVLSGGIQVVGLTTGLNATGVSTFATINATSYDEIEYDTWLFG